MTDDMDAAKAEVRKNILVMLAEMLKDIADDAERRGLTAEEIVKALRGTATRFEQLRGNGDD